MDETKILRQVLLSDYIKEYQDVLLQIIPELEHEVNFEQKSEWHIYDVWNHTLEAVRNCDYDFEDRLILLLHDIGKPFSYQDDENGRHFKGHATKSMQMARTILKRLGYFGEELEEMLMIIAGHATTIEVKNINADNKEFYKRLLKIQKCDASAYEKEHAKMILENMEEISKKFLT